MPGLLLAKKRSPVLIKTDFPSVARTAITLGVSKKETIELIKMMHETQCKEQIARFKKQWTEEKQKTNKRR